MAESGTGPPTHPAHRWCARARLPPGDRVYAYLGTELAGRLGVTLGQRVVLTAQDAGGTIAGQLVRVVGILHPGIQKIDRAVVHIPLETAANWLGGVTTSRCSPCCSSRVDSLTR